jgi:flagellar basal-body rod protein FlgB
MLQPLLAQSPLTLLKQVARFTERRQEILAGNIANIDTPGYRMRDLPVHEFQAALRQALRPGRSLGMFQPSPGVPWSLGQPQPLSFPMNEIDELFPETLFQAQTTERQPGITFQDGNNRSIEHQFLEMTKNSLMQNFALQVMAAQYSQLHAAITGQA